MSGGAESPKMKVLVVDDEVANLSAFQRQFRDDFEIMAATSAEHAIKLIAQQTFDVALVDFAMRNMNGVEFMRRASELQPKMARLLVTAHYDLEDVQQARTQNLAHGIVKKPWKRDDILRWVSTFSQMASMRSTVTNMRAVVAKPPKGS
jgi:response regulator RpfG family c-di-GMP phosphodiesterase